MHTIKTLDLGHHWAEPSEDTEDLTNEFLNTARLALADLLTKHRLSADQHPVRVHLTVEVTEET